MRKKLIYCKTFCSIFMASLVGFQHNAVAQSESNATTLSTSNLQTILENNRSYYMYGKVADYIPELGKADPKGIALAYIDKTGQQWSVGDVKQKFTLQSISKTIALMLAILENGEKSVFDKMGYYGSDKPFNHFANLETTGKPLNPMMNAGAILTTSMISEHGEVAFEKILNLVRFICNNPSINYNSDVYHSEKETGNRNRGLFYLLKNAGLIHGTEAQLDSYFKQCSIEVTVEDLAKIGYFFANQCVRFDGDRTYHNTELSRIIQSQMLIAGMYEFSGEYARTVGLPSKSGVGGGIIVSVPNRGGIGVYSPPLDQHGNSLAGYHMLIDFVKTYNLSLF
ncbi:glutaminase A [Sphingobacterium sp. Mn56C]|uniref:glutaminase A n=1 Tax=Sphingobacterium sp. Mn56C TaxID=3395261 RepID=UPI003BF5B668